MSLGKCIDEYPYFIYQQIKKLNTLNGQMQRRASRPSIVMPIKVRAPQSMRLDFSKKLQIASSGNFRY